MVDFTSGDALKIPLSELKLRLIDEKREWVNMAYQKMLEDGASQDTEELLVLRSRIISLFLELSMILKTHYPSQVDKIKLLCYSYNKDSLLKGFELLDEKVYKLNEENKETII